MARKPRSDSKLDALSPEQQEQLAQWLTIDNLSYEDAKARVLAEFGVSTSAAALQSFYSRFAAPWKYARAKDAADEFAQLAEGNFDEATLKKARQLAFDMLTSPKPDVESATYLLKILGDSAKLKIQEQKLALDARKVALVEKKAAQADAAEAVTRNTALTPAEQQAEYRRIFGMT